LGDESFRKGYETLKKISDAIVKKLGINVLKELTSQFYSYIPHDFGFNHMNKFIIQK
jgi:poly [ADP-ribose] polymerase